MHFFDKDSEDGRLQEITGCSSSPSDGGFIQNDVLNSTPKENKSTQTSQFSSPDVSPILHIKNNEEDVPRGIIILQLITKLYYQLCTS